MRLYTGSATPGSARPRGASTRTFRQAYRARLARTDPIRLSNRAAGLLPGACGHQLLGAVLEALRQGANRLERVDLVEGLVRAEIGDPRESQRIARLVPLRADDDVEGDFDDDG